MAKILPFWQTARQFALVAIAEKDGLPHKTLEHGSSIVLRLPVV